MNSLDFFNQYYKKNEKKHQYSSSLLNFFEHDIRHRLNVNGISSILDIGCGNYSLFEDIKNLTADIHAIDFSPMAIAQSPKSKIVYDVASVCDTPFLKEKAFDLIFDSHCLNCLLEDSQRDSALKNLFDCLNLNGYFCSELMVQPIGRNVSMPFKNIKTAHELEAELISHGFKILYFMISKDIGFVNESNGNDVYCDLLRVIATK